LDNDDSVNLFYEVTDRQVAAVTRLLYYFPRESVPKIAERLSKLDVRDVKGSHRSWRERETSNGVRTDYFIKAVSWCKEPAIRAALADISRRTTDREIRAALPASDGPEAEPIRKR
jgi:hypothetical protein